MRTRVHPIVLGGLLAGVLDILAALALQAWNGSQATRVLQAIASGLLGRSAFQGGPGTAALGLALHFMIAFGAATLYYAASLRWPFLTRRAVICGLAYGVVVYAVMNRVILPLSRVNFPPPTVEAVVRMVVIHMFCVGLPIALSVRRALGPSASQS